MIKILLCCGGGFSSSAISQRMKKEIIQMDMEDQVSIDFLPFSLGTKEINNYDIMVCCPHLNIYVKQLVEKQTIAIPIYILPPKMYGRMEIKEIYKDAIDIIKIFENNQTNPVSFPGENNVLRIQRQCAFAHKN